jgi:hypothetical protein
MKNFRRMALATINAIVLGWLFKIVLFDGTSDTLGTVVVSTFLFLGVYNLYLFVVYKIYPENKCKLIYTEFIYVGISVLPLIILWYFTS